MNGTDIEFCRKAEFTKEEISETEKIIEQAPSQASVEAVISAEIVYLKEETERAVNYIVDDSSEVNEEMRKGVLKNLRDRKKFFDQMTIKLFQYKKTKEQKNS